MSESTPLRRDHTLALPYAPSRAARSAPPWRQGRRKGGGLGDDHAPTTATKCVKKEGRHRERSKLQQITRALQAPRLRVHAKPPPPLSIRPGRVQL